MKKFLALAVSWLVFAAAAIEAPQPAPGAAAKDDEQQQEPAPPPAGEKPDAAPPAAESAAAEEPAPEEDDEKLPPMPADVAAGPSPGRFTPSEKVRADFPVSFPIDI